MSDRHPDVDPARPTASTEPAPPPATAGDAAAARPPASGRRVWMQRVAGGGAAAAVAGVVAWRGGLGPFATTPPTQAELDRATLSRIVDRIVPRDETPGAVDLGVDARLLAEMDADAAMSLIWMRLLEAVDRRARVEHRAPFLDLDAARQDALLQALSESPPTADGVRGWNELRRRTMALYWSHPDVGATIGLPHPPQPLGWMDHAEPPPARARV